MSHGPKPTHSEDDENVVKVLVDSPQTLVTVAVAGSAGKDGNLILSGEDEPTAEIGKNGDYYIRTTATAAYLYGPKEDVIWPFITSFGPTRRHIFPQLSPSDEWVITHNLGGNPAVTIADASNAVVFGEVSYISDSQVRIRFSAPFAGFAYLT